MYENQHNNSQLSAQFGMHCIYHIFLVLFFIEPLNHWSLDWMPHFHFVEIKQECKHYISFPDMNYSINIFMQQLHTFHRFEMCKRLGNFRAWLIPPLEVSFLGPSIMFIRFLKFSNTFRLYQFQIRNIKHSFGLGKKQKLFAKAPKMHGAHICVLQIYRHVSGKEADNLWTRPPKEPFAWTPAKLNIQLI